MVATVAALTILVPGASAIAAPHKARPAADARLQRQVAPTEEKALAAAAATDQRVEVTQLRSETTQVFAEPDGRLTAESAAVPQRVRQADGSWMPVKLALVPSPDGTLRPEASVADVRFSNGGSGPLVTVVRSGKTMTLSWPGHLDPPKVDDSSARYAEVLPDVDLVVRATDTGFTHVLVIKTPQAAADPKVRQVRYRLGGDARVAVDPAGGLRATVGETVLATAEPAEMWDSSVTTTTGLRSPAAAATAPDLSTAVAPGETAKVAPVTTSIDGEHLVLHPNATLLNAPPAAFPLYVDPKWSTGKNKWAYATNNNSNNGDTSVARVGKDPEGAHRTYRSFFNFPIGFLNKRYVHAARVEMVLDHSASCGLSWTHMYRSGAIAATPRTKWSPKLTTWVAAAESRAPEGPGCPGKADQIVNFTNAALTEQMNAAAGHSVDNMTFGFCACNDKGEYETATGRWKKFLPNKAKLVVEYATRPYMPTKLLVSGVACPASRTVSIGTPAAALTATYEDADEDQNQTITATYELVEVTSAGRVKMTPPGSRSVPAGSSTTSAKMTGLLKDRTYAIRTQATDPKPYNLIGPWSPWCTFTVDTAVPEPPDITVVTPPTLPGMAATVTLTSRNKDVTSFAYGWDDMPLRTANATGTTSKTATVALTAPRYGDLTLFAYAIDVTRNKGNNASTVFENVGRPSEAIARWRLESYPGAPAAHAFDDLRPAVAGDTPLTAEAISPDSGWQADARLLGASTATFDRTRGGAGGALLASVPALDTSKSFGVSAWARVTDDTSYQTLVSKEGAQMSAFRLQYRPQQHSWCMTMRARDVKGSLGVEACAPSASFKLGTWTHLAGVYDAADVKIRLYVDGVLAADLALPPDYVAQWANGWNASGPVVVGRASDTGLTPRYVDYFHGEIADLQLFDRALVSQDLLGQRAEDPHSNGFDEPGIVTPVRVGSWNFREDAACYAAGDVTCAAQDGSDWSRPLMLTPGSTVGEGVQDNALVLDGTHFAPEGDPLHGTATQEYGVSQRQVASASSSLESEDAPVLRTDQPFTVAAWVRLDDEDTTQTVLSQDAAGPGFSGFDVAYRAADHKWVFVMRNAADVTDAAQQSTVTATADDPTSWHQLVAVFDPGQKELRLYADATKSAAAIHAGLVPWQATGPLVVGRSDQPGGPTNWLYGSLDNVTVWQGVLTDTSIKVLHQQQASAVDPG